MKNARLRLLSKAGRLQRPCVKHCWVALKIRFRGWILENYFNGIGIVIREKLKTRNF